MKPRFEATLYTALGLIGIFGWIIINDFLFVKSDPSLWNIPVALLASIGSIFWLSCIGLCNLIGLSALIDTQTYTMSLSLFTLCTIILWSFTAFVSGYIYEKIHCRHQFVRVLAAAVPPLLLLLCGLGQLANR